MAKKLTKAQQARARELHDEWVALKKYCWDAAAENAKAKRPAPYTHRHREADSLVMTALFGRLMAMEERIAELEANPLTYRGTFEEGVTYPARSFVSHGGSMWFTPTKTKSRPNEGAPWKLVVKHGRDGKDAR
jgi:hypothetical protein